jgi:hypothetical protein
MNISLLTKWKWRLFSEEQSIWKNVLINRYGDGVRGFGWMSRTLSSNVASIWWNDLVKIGVVEGEDRLNGIFYKKIGNGGDTSFWHDTWVGVNPLKEVFPRLFLISTQKDHSVLEVRRLILGRWEWDLKWRRNLFVWEEERRDMLVNILTPIQLTNSNDEWKCTYSTGGMFSVCSLYRYLSGIIIPPISLEPDIVSDLGWVWKSWAPSKVIVFSWQLLFRRLPTKVNLAIRGVVGDETESFCSLCPLGLEGEGHLFGSCAFAAVLWDKVFHWLGWGGGVPRDPLLIFRKFKVCRGIGKRLKGLVAIWHAVVSLQGKGKAAAVDFDKRRRF